MPRLFLTRVLGAATAAYSVALAPALRSRGTARKVGGVAVGWGAFCALAGWYDETR